MDSLCLDSVSETLKVYQKPGVFRYGTDAVLLARFAARHIGTSKQLRFCDLCAGTGIVGLMLCDGKPTLHGTLVEIDAEAAGLSVRSTHISGLDARVRTVCADIVHIREYFAPESFDFVTCNPPYMTADCGKMCGDDAITAARHEIYCTVSDVMNAASFLLPTGGSAYFVYRTERLAALMAASEAAKLAVKELVLVQTKASDTECRLMLCRAVKGAKAGMKTYVSSTQDILSPDNVT